MLGIMSQINALFGVLLGALIVQWCTKIDKYQVCIFLDSIDF